MVVIVKKAIENATSLDHEIDQFNKTNQHTIQYINESEHIKHIAYGGGPGAPQSSVLQDSLHEFRKELLKIEDKWNCSKSKLDNSFQKLVQ